MIKYLIIAILFLVFVFFGLGQWEKSDKSRKKKLGIVFFLIFFIGLGIIWYLLND